MPPVPILYRGVTGLLYILCERNTSDRRKNAACITKYGYVRPSCLYLFPPSWRELSGSELQQASKAFQERDTSTVGVVQEAVAVASGGGAANRNGWERYGARYFKGGVKVKEAGGKDRNVELQVEVSAVLP